MKKFILPLFSLVFLTAACSSKTHVSHNYYDDGIYYDPSSTPEEFGLNDIRRSSAQAPVNIPNENDRATANPNAADQLDYYDPSDNDPQYYDEAASYRTNGATTVINNNYYGPSYRNPGWNSGFYWNSWGGWGMNVGYAWGSPNFGWGGYYNPWFYDPFFYDPYWGWSPWCGINYNRPWRGYGWNAGYGGYNSYWAGYYNGYYHGSINSDMVGGRNIAYVNSNNLSNRTNSFNAINRNRVNKAGLNNTGRSYSRTAARTTADGGRTESASRNPRTDSRFSNENIRPTIARSRGEEVSRQLTADNGRRSTESALTSPARSRAYASETYERVRSRTTNDSRRTDYSGVSERRQTERATTPSRTSDGYSRSRNADTRPSNRENLYVPSQTRAKQYNNGQTRSRTPERPRSNLRTTPSRPDYNRNYTPSRTTPSRPDNSNRNYVPSPSSPSRNYTPSRSAPSRNDNYSSPSRSSSPSYNRGGSNSRSYSPSRSSGSSRSGSSGRSRR